MIADAAALIESGLLYADDTPVELVNGCCCSGFSTSVGAMAGALCTIVCLQTAPLPCHVQASRKLGIAYNVLGTAAVS
jgi:hypothetical protein